MARTRKRLLTFNDPQPLRIDRRLAMEIGFLESVVLLQIEYLISISHNERNGQFWTYQTLQELKDKHFPWLSLATICRTLKSLEDARLIVRGNFNQTGFDRTVWYALNYAGIRALQSVRVGEDAPILQNEKSNSQNGMSNFQNENSLLQNEKSKLQIDNLLRVVTTETLTENTAKSSTEKTTGALHVSPTGAAHATHSVVALLCNCGITQSVAVDLAGQYPEKAILEQIAALPFREAKRPSAVLVSAIREGWALPEGYLLELQRRETEEDQQQALRQTQEEKERVIRLNQFLDEQVDSYWTSLSEEQQVEVDQIVWEQLQREHPFMAGRLKKNPNSAPALATVGELRRKVLIGRLGLNGSE
jgi:DNA-binding PadR family transcriptional regulator